MIQLRQLQKKSDTGLVLDWRFHRQNRWVSAQSAFLVNAIIEAFDPVIITSQLDYEWHKGHLKKIIAMEPGWAAPKIRYDRRQSHLIGVFASDPHNKTGWFQQYVEENGIRYVFSYYYHPFLHHFPKFDPQRLVHMPWAVPDEFICDAETIAYLGQRVLHIFGGAKSEAYEVRNWCRGFPFVEDHRNSGVENKTMDDSQYFLWLRQFDAVIAAGSLSPKYRLVTPKYFEIPAAGSLLFAQYCEDLELLGFNPDNAVIFDRSDFEDQALEYLKNPESYLGRRKQGCRLVAERHKISDRVQRIRSLMG